MQRHKAGFLPASDANKHHVVTHSAAGQWVFGDCGCAELLLTPHPTPPHTRYAQAQVTPGHISRGVSMHPVDAT